MNSKKYYGSPPELAPEAEWRALDIPYMNKGGSSFIHGDRDGDRLRIRLFLRNEDDRLFGKVWFGPGAEGPPGHAHGGSMAAVLDDVMGIAGWVAGHPVVAAKITVEFRRKLPLGTIAWAESWVEEVVGKKVTSVARLYAGDELNPFATSSGLFIRQPLESFRALAETNPFARSHLGRMTPPEV